MPNKPITIYKLIVLYMLSKVDALLPSGIIYDYVTNHGYTNYFTLQSALGDLLQANLIAEDNTYRQSYYGLTDAGRETLTLFGTTLSLDIRREARNYLKARKYDILDETSLVSDYCRTEDGSYLATCTLREDTQVLFQLKLNVATESDAMKVCNNWHGQSATLYQQAMAQLLRSE